MSEPINPLARQFLNTQQLVLEFPPLFVNANKKVVYRLSCPPGATHFGRLVVSRWAKMPLPNFLDGSGTRPKFVARPDYFAYEPTPPEAQEVEWYLNFSHSHLFCAYSGGLFAQDEMQVTEHPALGSLREALLQSDLKPLTVENREPTPILIMGAERRCAVATEPNAEQGRPDGLYGNRFSRASAATIEKATRVIDPPTVTNIIAMEAPDGGTGRYTRSEIEFILSTAYTGFVAARIESQRERDASYRVVVHTGFWGCGAYGGHRVLMALLQFVAARLAGLDRLVFHTGDSSATERVVEASRLLKELENRPQPRAVADLIDEIAGMGFEWGVGDGN